MINKSYSSFKNFLWFCQGKITFKVDYIGPAGSGEGGAAGGGGDDRQAAEGELGDEDEDPKGMQWEQKSKIIYIFLLWVFRKI